MLVVGLALAPVVPAKTPKRTVKCTVSTGGGSSEGESLPAELSSPLEAGVVSRFAVLRRAALPSDQIPALSPVGVEVDSQLASFYPASVRQVLALPNGSRYFVVPGFAQSVQVPPADCLPPSLRHDRPELVEQESKLASAPVYCIVEIGREPAGSECVPFSLIEESPRVFGPTLPEETLVELVPDGVASVRVTYPGGASAVAAVAENAYMLVPPRAVQHMVQQALKKLQHRASRFEHDKHTTKAQQRRVLESFIKQIHGVLLAAAPLKVEWLGGAGELIRSIARPSAASSLISSAVGIGL